MKNPMSFSLTGYGHLLDLDMTGDTAKARIEVIPCTIDSGTQIPDAVTLDCEIDPQLCKRLSRFNKQIPVAEGVAVRFKANYRYFSFCHHGAKPGDPDNMLLLQAELVEVTDWHRDGSGLAN